MSSSSSLLLRSTGIFEHVIPLHYLHEEVQAKPAFRQEQLLSHEPSQLHLIIFKISSGPDASYVIIGANPNSGAPNRNCSNFFKLLIDGKLRDHGSMQLVVMMVEELDQCERDSIQLFLRTYVS